MFKIKRLADLINIVMISQILSVFALFLLDAFTGTDSHALLLFAGFFVILCFIWLFRTAIKKMPVYLLAHMLLIAATCSLFFVCKTPSLLISAGLFTALAAFAFLLDILFWTSAVREEKSMPVAENGEAIQGFVPIFKEGIPYVSLPFVVAFILGLAYALYAHLSVFEKTAYVMGVLYIGEYYLRLYLERMSELIRNMQRETGALPKRMLFANARLTIPLLVVIFLSMFLFQSDTMIFVLDTILLWIAKGALWLFIKALWLISLLGGAGESGATMNRGVVGLQASDGPLWLIEAIEFLLRALLLGALLFLLVRALIRFVRFFSQRQINARRETGFAQMTEVREHLRSSRGKRRKKRADEKSPAAKIRRLYRQFVRKWQKKGLQVSKSETPFERVQGLLQITQREESEVVDITSLYSLARYNPQSVKEADVKRMENLV